MEKEKYMKWIRIVWVVVAQTIFALSLVAAEKKDEPEDFPFRRPVLKAPANFYTFLELDQQKLAEEAQKQAEGTPNEPEAKKRINEYYRQQITNACKTKREKLEQQIKDAAKAVEEADELTRERKEFELIRLRFYFQLTTSFCPTLLDPNKRKEYDEYLANLEKADAGYFVKLQEGVHEALLLAPDKKVVLNQLLGLAFSDLIQDIPGPALKVFNQNIELRSISGLTIPYGPEVRYGIGFTGLMAFNKFEIRVSVYVIQDIYGDRRMSISFELPEHYKLSDLIPSITWLDTFTFPKSKIILASFEGIDIDGFSFKKGFNYAAIVDLKGPLAALNALKDQSQKLKSLVFEAKPILLSGLINPFDWSKTMFAIKVPLYFGIDLRKIGFMPSVVSKVINQITTDELNLRVDPFKKRIVGIVPLEPKKYELTLPSFLFRIRAETGARIVLGTQKDPIRLTFNGLLEPASEKHPEGYLSFGGNLKNMIEFNWLAIGNATLQLDIDPMLMKMLVEAGYPLPFSGLLTSGQVDLGKPGDTRAQLKIAGGFRAMTPEKEAEIVQKIDTGATAKKEALPVGQKLVELIAKERKGALVQLPELLFDVSAENIRFADLISYATKLAAKTGIIKKEVPVTALPTMTLHKVWGHIALTDTRIADKEYKAGVGLQVETEFWQHKAGFRVQINDAFRLNGWGYLPAININAQGKNVFHLYGPTEDKGPRLVFAFDPREPQKGIFSLNAVVVIPALGLRQLVDFKWYAWWLNAEFESKFAGFSVIFGLRMNVKAKPPITAEMVQKAQEQITVQEQKEEEQALQEVAQALREQIKPDEFEKWRQLYIKFGFKDDFAEFLNEQLVPALRNLKSRAIAQLDKISQSLAQMQEQGAAETDQEITMTKKEIEMLQQEIAVLQENCNQTSGLKRIQCTARIAAKKAIIQSKNAYIALLVRSKRAIVQSATRFAQKIVQAKALRKVAEGILEGASQGLEFLASGIKILRVKRAEGEYSYRDLMNLKLPRLVILVLEFNFGEQPMRFVLEDVQFDFKNPKESSAHIIFSVIQAFISSQNEKYARYIMELAKP
jgi:hypothetical protein